MKTLKDKEESIKDYDIEGNYYRMFNYNDVKEAVLLDSALLNKLIYELSNDLDLDDYYLNKIIEYKKLKKEISGNFKDDESIGRFLDLAKSL